MATYLELFNLVRGDSGSKLRSRVAVAVAIKAHSILGEPTPSADRKQWAGEALMSPSSKAEQVLFYMLAQDNAQDADDIENVSDANMQSRADSAIDKLHP